MNHTNFCHKSDQKQQELVREMESEIAGPSELAALKVGLVAADIRAHTRQLDRIYDLTTMAAEFPGRAVIRRGDAWASAPRIDTIRCRELSAALGDFVEARQPRHCLYAIRAMTTLGGITEVARVLELQEKLIALGDQEIQIAIIDCLGTIGGGLAVKGLRKLQLANRFDEEVTHELDVALVELFDYTYSFDSGPRVITLEEVEAAMWNAATSTRVIPRVNIPDIQGFCDLHRQTAGAHLDELLANLARIDRLMSIRNQENDR